MNECLAEAQDCVVAASFHRQCSVAVVGESGTWTSGFGQTIDQAARDAISTCSRLGYNSCRIIVANCMQ